MFKKLRERKYIILPPGKSNLTLYDKKLLLAMFFVNIAFTGALIMYIGLYWNKQTDSHKKMAEKCSLALEMKQGEARMDSEMEMLNAKSRMQNSPIGIKIEPTKEPRKYLPGLIKEYEEKFLNKQ